MSVDFQGLDPATLATRSWHDRPDLCAPPPAGTIDACVHPRPRPGELHAYLPRAWQGRRLPAGERYYYPNPVGDYLQESYAAGLPGSDPALTASHVFTNGVDQAVLLPLTLGLLPDIDLLSAICAATNEWLAATWLTDARWKGTVRVAPSDPGAAVAEIERWAADPRFVQVGVPTQSMQLYGNRVFLPIWEAAARHGLPIVLHTDAETGVELAPTTGGYLRHYLGFAAYHPLTAFNHLVSFMTGGVLDRLPALRLVFADGGYDMCAPFMWRLDKDWRPMRGDMPWMTRLPSAYIAQHVRFIAHSLEGPEDPALLEEWLGISDAGHTLLYGSNYPAWNMLHADAAFPTIEPALRRRILADNARALYNGLKP